RRCRLGWGAGPWPPALMRAGETRPDTVVYDEPLYAFYLDRTGLDHPGRDAVVASQSTDWRGGPGPQGPGPTPPGRGAGAPSQSTDWRVVLDQQASAPLPAGASISYGKHMTHHLLP